MNEDIHWLPEPIPLNALSGIWIREYRARPYLRTLSDRELDERVTDIVSNMMALHDDGKYRPRFNLRADGIYASIRGLDFLRMATDADEEMRFRGTLGAKAPLPSARLQLAKRLSDESWCRRPDWVAASRLSLDAYEHPKMLFRLSKKDWNDDFYRFGRVRFSPASHYKDSAALLAVGDDELQMEWFDAQLVRQSALVDDYYCLCFSSEYDYRLFADFQADSCVAILDLEELTVRLRRAIERYNRDHPDNRIAAMFGCPIIYIDPFAVETPTEAKEVQFTKHFRFAYQTEFRFVLSPVHKGTLEPLFLTLGALTDIAEMVSSVPRK